MKKSLFIIGLLAVLWHLYVFIPVLFSVNEPIGELKIFDRKNVLITHLPKSGGFQIPISEDLTYEAGEGGRVEAKWVEPLPENLVKSFTAIEDERFTSHWGIDALAKLRAFKDNVNAKKIVSGGSTITEQWVKNEFFPHADRTILQKLREATVAFYSSAVFSKEEILRKYLNTIYFGHRNYGIKAAMKSYFDKSHLEALTEEEIITLLAIIRSPGVINLNEQYFQDRWERIAATLRSSAGRGVLSPSMGESQREGHSRAALELKPFQGLNKFPHVTVAIRQQTPVDSPGTTVAMSTVDSTLQTEAEKLINQSLTRLSGKNVTNGAAYVVQPSTGDILVWVGSKDFYDKTIDGQVNIITQKRQMGSALKPFVYLYAFTKGAHPDQLIVDLEKDFESAKQDEAYRPLNYGLREGGVMPLKLALANSFNISAVRLLEHLGLEDTYRFMKNLGLPFDQPAQHYGLSLALGSPDLKMQDVADAYAALANNGKRIQSHLLREASNNFELGTWNLELPYFYIFDVLSNPLNRRRSFGVNSILNTTIPFAVKTGTTKNFHDNWTFGYHPDLVVATWVGNNDNTPMIDVDGITGAGPIWHRLVEFAIQQGYVRDVDMVPPSNISQTKKCTDKECSRTELIYSEADRTWLSDLESGHYCLEDFFIRDIESTEITKIAELFSFKDFTIEWCKDAGNVGIVSTVGKVGLDRKDHTIPTIPELLILKPSPNETFYIRQDIPLELQQIILKANQSVDWYQDGVKVGSGENIFIQPIIGKHLISAQTSDLQQNIDIDVREIE